jgi:membrane-associated protease RseP (regulator of RpoE activity)
MSGINRLKRFLRLYFYRLNNGVPAGTRPLTAEEFSESRAGLADKKERRLLNLVLFIITMITTTFAGSVQGDTLYDTMVSGLSYSVSLMMILTVHEFGHYFAAKSFGVKTTLPFFIPFPSIVGTMGAVIKTRSPIPHNRALFYIGIMGPLPGFVVSVIAVMIGVKLSHVESLSVTASGEFVPIFGNSMLYGSIIYFIHGHIPDGYYIVLHPYAWAGWIGFLITSLNLLPIGQLDGGHILYSLIGRKQVYAGWITLAALVILTFIWPGWSVWIILTLLVLMVAHPRVPETEQLSLKEKIAGWFAMAVLVLTFIPVPVQI